MGDPIAGEIPDPILPSSRRRRAGVAQLAQHCAGLVYEGLPPIHLASLKTWVCGLIYYAFMAVGAGRTRRGSRSSVRRLVEWVQEGYRRSSRSGR
jgi:hypothetical protein